MNRLSLIILAILLLAMPSGAAEPAASKAPTGKAAGVKDGNTVITGSFNFTKNAEENNAENLLVIRSPELAAKYTANWNAHYAHSEPYGGRERG